MKKSLVILLLVLVCAAAAWMLLSGFSVNSSVYLDDFSVSDDGSALTFTVSVGSSMGYVRAYTDEGGGVKPHYLKFYSAWGGLNSMLGAKSQYTLTLSPTDTELYFYHGSGGYTLALQKGTDGVWHRPR